MNLYTTTDVPMSIHRAYGQFTHIVFNRLYTLHKRTIFDSKKIADTLTTYNYSPWLPSTGITNWKKKGGLLIDQHGHEPHVCDVLIFMECPISKNQIEKVTKQTEYYAVIPNPISWTIYDEYIDLHRPVTKHLKELWSVCGGKKMTNGELERESGWPLSQLMYMKAVFKPKEHWYIEKRLAPERDDFKLAWDWLMPGCTKRSEITNSGFKPQIEEMARLGHIRIKKVQHYPGETPDWKKLARDREQALKDLAAVRLLVESLPVHPEVL